MKTNKKILIAALIFAVFTTVLLFRYLNIFEPNGSNRKHIEICVAKENIPMNTKIDSSMIEMKKISIDQQIPNMILNANDAIGKYCNNNINEGEIIISNNIVDIEKIYFSYHIPKDKRAITVKVNDIGGVAHLIMPGDYVDVLVYTPDTEEKATKSIYPDKSNTILQNILVLAVNKDYRVVEPTLGVEDQEQQIFEKNITLAVSPNEAEKLLLVDEIGKIRLALRNSSDNTINNTTGAVRSNCIIK